MNLHAWMRLSSSAVSRAIRIPIPLIFAAAFLAMLAGSPRARAAEIEIPVANAESSFPAGYKGALVAVLDEDERDGSRGPIRLFRYRDSRNTKLEYTIEDIRRGMTLIRALGRDLLVMRSRDFDALAGGSIDVVFYREFLGTDRRQLSLQYHPEENDAWVLRTDDQRGRDNFDLIRLQIGTQLGAPTTLKEIRLFSVENGSQRLVRHHDSRELPRATSRSF